MSPKELCQYIEGRGNGADLAEQLHREKESLLSWGQENGILYNETTFSERKVGDEQYFGGGNEHDVYYDEELCRVVKVTKLPSSHDGSSVSIPQNFGAQGGATDYLTNLENHNRYFGDDIRIEGVLQIGDLVAIISSQPFISGRKATDDEIETWFISLDYEKGAQPNTFVLNATAKIIKVYDARPDNVIFSLGGQVIPIDLQIIVKDIEPMS